MGMVGKLASGKTIRYGTAEKTGPDALPFSIHRYSGIPLCMFYGLKRRTIRNSRPVIEAPFSLLNDGR